MAQKWRRVWAPTCLPASGRQRSAAVRACLRTNLRTASRPRAFPDGPGKTALCGSPPRSSSHVRRTPTVWLVKGVTRSFRPFPWTRTCAPWPGTTSTRRRPTSSDARSPVWMASSNSAWSRLPVQEFPSGAASNASISSRVRNLTKARSPRLAGMARTRAMSSACSGW